MIELLEDPEAPLPAGASYALQPAWARMCRRAFGWELRRWRVVEDGASVGVFALAQVRSRLFGTRLFGLPHCDESPLALEPGALAGESRRRALGGEILGLLDREGSASGALYAELRGLEPLPGSGLRCETPYCRFVLDLAPDYSRLRAAFDTNIHKNLKKAERTVSVQERRSYDEELHRIYLAQMRVFGSPPLPPAYFTGLLEGRLARLFTATVEGKTAAFLFLVVHDGVWHADVNAGLPRWDAFFPKVRLFDETIHRARAEGARAYDFMRTRPNSGVWDHKRKWGGREVPIHYHWRVYRDGGNLDADPEQARYRLPRLLFRWMPEALARRLGPPLRAGLAK
ncbi:MAG: GNAT family N-acetyltransferase [Elusimicrobiota bacterium]|jgi:CelD/BcsL family acetyltransferase involved in cellulose biosynthesis